MVEYHKIETIYNRATNGSKKLIEGSWRNPTVEYLRNLTWIFTEKIDGTNIRVHWDGHKVIFGGRTDNSQIPSHLMNYLISVFDTPEAEELFEQKFGELEVTLFGEGYGPKIQSGGSYRDDVSFILFDVMISGNFQPRGTVVDVAQVFGIDVVPVVFIGPIERAVELVKTAPDSHFGHAKMEGVVGRPCYELKDRCGNRVIVKIKVRDFDKVGE